MKHKEIESILKQAGYWIARANKHEVWTNGVKTIVVPRHKELSKFLARSIIRECSAQPEANKAA